MIRLRTKQGTQSNPSKYNPNHKMTNYNKNTRPELLQIIRKYNKDATFPYLKIKNYNHDNKYILVKTCEAIDEGNDAVKQFINGGKDAVKSDKNVKKTYTLTPPSVSPVKTDTPPSVSPVSPVSPVKADETDDDTDESDDDADDTKEKKKETREEFEARIKVIAKAKYPKNPAGQLRFMVEKCGGIIGGIRFG